MNVRAYVYLYKCCNRYRRRSRSMLFLSHRFFSKCSNFAPHFFLLPRCYHINFSWKITCSVRPHTSILCKQLLNLNGVIWSELDHWEWTWNIKKQKIVEKIDWTWDIEFIVCWMLSEVVVVVVGIVVIMMVTEPCESGFNKKMFVQPNNGGGETVCVYDVFMIV